jgi:hypothetical protein
MPYEYQIRALLKSMRIQCLWYPPVNSKKKEQKEGKIQNESLLSSSRKKKKREGNAKGWEI